MSPRSAGISPYKLASVLLQYPTGALFDGLDELDAAARTVSPQPSREAFTHFLRWLRDNTADDVAKHYVATFDLRRRCALYLTYYRHGDTRKRGQAMLEFKAAYRVAGFEVCDDELPDYLPLVLEFASLSSRGEQLLRRHRADLELLRKALSQAETPYAELVNAACARLPKPGRRDLALVKQAWESGPPTEEVGLEPFAPPEYLRGYSEQAQTEGTS